MMDSQPWQIQQKLQLQEGKKRSKKNNRPAKKRIKTEGNDGDFTNSLIFKQLLYALALKESDDLNLIKYIFKTGGHPSPDKITGSQVRRMRNNSSTKPMTNKELQYFIDGLAKMRYQGELQDIFLPEE